MKCWDDVGDVGAEAFDGRGDFIPNLIHGERGKVVTGERFIGVSEADADEFAGCCFVEHVGETEPVAVCFIRISGTDATFGGADFIFSECRFACSIELAVVGEHDVCSV